MRWFETEDYKRLSRDSQAVYAAFFHKSAKAAVSFDEIGSLSGLWPQNSRTREALEELIGRGLIQSSEVTAKNGRTGTGKLYILTMRGLADNIIAASA